MFCWIMLLLGIVHFLKTGYYAKPYFLDLLLKITVLISQKCLILFQQLDLNRRLNMFHEFYLKEKKTTVN